MLRVYSIFIDGVQKLVKANSKKDVRKEFNVETVDFWCNITKKNEYLLRNLLICGQNK